MLKSFQELEAWKKAYDLTLEIYGTTRGFPQDERFGLISQLRRASSSVAANIAEGYGRRTTKELLRSLRIANGEAEETRYFSLLSKDLSYMNQQEFDTVNQLCRSVSQLLSALGRSLQASAARVSSHQSRVTQSTRRQT